MANIEKKYLYHFTKRETLIEHILPNLKLKLSSLEETNDLVENKLHIQRGIANALSNNILGLENYLNLRQEILYSLKNVYKICCFSDNYDLSRMWATYGNNHKGVCLRIDYEKFCRVNELNSNKSYCKKVVYKPQLNYDSIVGLKSHKNLDHKEVILKVIRKNIKTIFFTKQKNWNSEREVRYLTIEKKDFCSIKESLDGIILGEKFEGTYLPSILNQIDINIDIFKIQALSNGHLYLNKMDIEKNTTN